MRLCSLCIGERPFGRSDRCSQCSLLGGCRFVNTQEGTGRWALVLRSCMTLGSEQSSVSSESKSKIMRTMLIVVGVLLMLVGTVWFFQGINVLPGSFMTGQT